jgi:hypothetical protein
MCKKTGRNGRRKNIGTGIVIKTAVGKARMTAVGMASRVAGMVIKTAKENR